MKEYYSHNLPSLVVVLTDGFAPYPDKALLKTPVIWCLTSEGILPPVGEYVIVKSERY